MLNNMIGGGGRERNRGGSGGGKQVIRSKRAEGVPTSVIKTKVGGGLKKQSWCKKTKQGRMRREERETKEKKNFWEKESEKL